MPRRLREQVCQGQVLLAGSPVGAKVYDNEADGGTVLAPENHYWEF